MLMEQSRADTTAHERRLMRRFDMRLPASVELQFEAGERLTETQNISARGVFFYLDRTLAEGSEIRVTLAFPPQVTLTESVRVRFIARVIRVEAAARVAQVGIAALIEQYEFLRSNGEVAPPPTQ